MTNISKNLVIRAMQENDWESVAQIYQEGMDTDMATFETQVPSWEKWNLGHLKVCRLVVEQDHKVVAWAALSPVSTSCLCRSGRIEHICGN
jgi:phosphinothricin acetyltransferase